MGRRRAQAWRVLGERAWTQSSKQAKCPPHAAFTEGPEFVWGCPKRLVGHKSRPPDSPRKPSIKGMLAIGVQQAQCG